ncbi:MAG: 5'-methylthioadenosine/adenosylhomocysteine nucleosidase [Leptolyngbya sp. SIO3F4]|nr:5'-methylthioadenosine/adenosylhomocysteine nucleosidase [Leptolyngbya sp. SIO3F4]
MAIAIMSAMDEENAKLVAELGDSRDTVEKGMRVYHSGMLWGIPSVVVFSRWGKVAAATTATYLIAEFEVDEIIFTGVAGGADPALRPGDVVVATELCQHDMNATPLFPRHEIPLIGKSTFESNGDRRLQAIDAAKRFLQNELTSQVDATILKEFGIVNPKVIEGEVASGDSFIAAAAELQELKSRLPRAACVEMEGAAVAQVCYEYGVPVTVIRTISDAADEDAVIDFPKFISTVASTYSHGILEQLFKELGS